MSKTRAHQLIMPVASITRVNSKWEQDCLRALSCWFSCKLGCIWALFKINNSCSKTETAQRATNEARICQCEQQKQNCSVMMVIIFKGKHFYRPPILFWQLFHKQRILGTDTICRRNILWKIKTQFSLYPTACPDIWSRVSEYERVFNTKLVCVWILVIHTQKRIIWCLSPETMVYWDRLERFSEEYYLQCIIWN